SPRADRALALSATSVGLASSMSMVPLRIVQAPNSSGPILPARPALLGTYDGPAVNEYVSSPLVSLWRRRMAISPDRPDQVFANVDVSLWFALSVNGLVPIHPEQFCASTSRTATRLQ